MFPMRTATWLPTPFLGFLGGWLATWVHWPLPWITGALICVTVCRCIGWQVAPIPHGRPAGQWIIATAVGLHFTSRVLQEVLGHLPLMATAAVATVALSALGIACLHKCGMNRATAFFAFMPANFAEMINLGERYAADVSRVAAAHSLRLVIIVLVVPPVMLWAPPGISSVSHSVPAPDPSWLLPMMAIGLAGGTMWKRLGWPNPWMFGPLIVCSVITVAFGVNTSLPPLLSHLAQVLIGCTLACHFDRAFFKRSPGFLLLAAAYTLLILGATFIGAWLLSLCFAVPFPTLALGITPGSMTEMYLTADALGLDVGTVTAMQILRLVVVMAAAEPIYRYWRKRSHL
jgi:uncharacterized protein